jgi:uncharacterized membrane protein
VETGWKALVARWTEAGVIDADTADRIRVFEEHHAPAAVRRWPVLLALALGGLMLGAAVLLFVSAHWDSLSPATRFALVVGMVGVFHVAGAASADRFPALGSVLHGAGTVALGAGVFLAGQIFNLDEHWPSGVMLWALGAALGWALLRDAPQLALVAVLVPAWLASEWIEQAMWASPWERGARVTACGIFSLVLAYFAAVDRERPSTERRVLIWIGGIALLPAAGFLSANLDAATGFVVPGHSLPFGTIALGWTIALALPMAVSVILRGRSAWMQAVAMLWVVAALYARSVAGDIFAYAWWALGAVGLVFWGLHDRRSERINMGAVLFAITVLTFYFSEVMSKLERSASLAGLGILFLAGGWALERTRRRLVRLAQGART